MAKPTWELAAPAPSPFGAVAGDNTEYQVRMLTVKSKKDDAVLDALAEVLGETVRLAPNNVTAKRNVILFAWDPVYASLTVTFTNKKRADDGRDVLKLLCTAWDREAQGAHGEMMMALRAEQIERAIRLVVPETKQLLEQLFPKHDVIVGFTTDPHGARFKTLR